jgi:transcriptional regulator with XRE-family HTH domain
MGLILLDFYCRLRYDYCRLRWGLARKDPPSRAMKLGEKIRYLRAVEGSLRGLDRAMSQLELVRAIEAETGSRLSQSYLSQIENGARPHLTNTTRQILAGFFKVHPGYLVDDPDGYSPELQSELRNVEDKLDLWLVSGAERFRRDPELKQALLAVARNDRSRECLLLLEAILETPELMPRLAEVLRPQIEGSVTPAETSRSTPVKAQGSKNPTQVESPSLNGNKRRNQKIPQRAR